MLDETIPAGTEVEYLYEAKDENVWLCLEGQEYQELEEDLEFSCDVWIAQEYNGEVLCEIP